MWKVIRASVIGTSHAGSNLPCQDDCYANVMHDADGLDYLVCIVSDGAGSAKEGGKGAELACVTARSSIEAALGNLRSTSLDETFVEEWIKDVRRAIYETADANALTARDYACTLLGAVVSPNKAVFFQIGDGAIVASSGYAQGVVFWPDSGLYANMTNFVTDEDALAHLHVSVTSARIDEVALFSDGIQRLALSFEQRTPHTPFFEPMLNVLRRQNPVECETLDEQLARFLNSPQINERTDDDKTLVLATHRAP
nr:serine/threonine protein phosphatase [uncultured bacterium]